MTRLPRDKDKPREGINTVPAVDIPSHSLKVAVIREELVALTHDSLIAVVLNQLLYWTLRVKDFDLLLEEEKQFNPECFLPPRHGWIYKTAQDLIEETMLHVSCSTMRRYLKTLIKNGWIDERPNPHYKFNKTTQYRLNLSKLQNDLMGLGYNLPGFSLSRKEKGKKLKPAENPNVQIESSSVQNEDPNAHFEDSKSKNCSFIYLTETTSKTTNKDHTHGVCKKNSLELKKNDVSSSMAELWKKHIGQDEIQLTKNRKTQLQSLLNLHFENDLSKWEDFCKRVKVSPFLMGEGPNKWHVTFHWILLKDNILKVLEGNYDSPEILQKKKEIKAKDIREEKTREVLESIEDSYWKEWCGQLSEFPQNGYLPVNKPLYWWQLERIKNARFLDFDERLVTIGSSDPNVLKEIEDNRFQVASVVSRTFPTLRTIRTELIKAEKEMPTNLIPSSSLNPRVSHFNTQQEGAKRD